MDKYAIIRTGGKQYRVQEGDVINVELLDKPEFDILMVKDGGNITVGQPVVEKASVKAEILGEVKGPKVIAYKYKRRKNYHRKVGHRQKYSKVKITGIQHGS